MEKENQIEITIQDMAMLRNQEYQFGSEKLSHQPAAGLVRAAHLGTGGAMQPHSTLAAGH